MDVFHWQAKLVRRSAHLLAHYLEQTSPDRLNWRPYLPESAEMRSAFDIVFECAKVNRRFTALLLDREAAPAEKDHSYSSLADAKNDLLTSAEDLAKTIEGLPEAALDREFKTASGQVKGKFLLELPVNNMYYHGGQINMIQLLYGDPEFHRPADFTQI